MIATGNTNLGADTLAGATSIAPTGCFFGTGQDVLDFRNDASGNATGLHSYACGFGSFEFGSRSSGENTYYADGSAQVTTTITGDSFGFSVSPGQVGAFGSTSFVAGEYQYAELTIRLIIDGTLYLDEFWSTNVGTGGATTSIYNSLGLLSVTNAFTSGAGFASYGLPGQDFFLTGLGAGSHSIDYQMISVARGMVSSMATCRATIYAPQGGGEGGGEGGGDNGGGLEDVAAAFLVEVPNDFVEFNSFCGAGAQSGDPFPPIARAIPEPATAALFGLAAALLVAGAARRRRVFPA
ncbi:MAG: PEP-CTERM sorting domain-containing protein [Burkholderiales bacterium]|nr:PEP-CTERM sorting domain-containing protein [Burkholderiales bacterium]